LINRAEVCNFNKKLVPIEFFEMLKLNIAETLEFILAHQQRHIHQAVKIAQTINQKESYLKV
ncbi:MAG: DinB family protein, partial [Chryseotalea sp.]